MLSMTGFGYAEKEIGGFSMSVEIKSLNTRYLDIIVSLPSALSVLESNVRKIIQENFSRGRIEVYIRVKDLEESIRVSVDKKAAEAWREGFFELMKVLNIRGGKKRTLSVDLLSQMDGVFKTEKTRKASDYKPVMEELLNLASETAMEDKKREGAFLARDIENQLGIIESSLMEIEKHAPEVRKEIEKSMRERFLEILGDENSEQRIMQEVAVWIVKTDINEEIIRLRSHLSAFRNLSAAENAVGKKLDFLAQEMGREINTIGSKSPQAQVSMLVVDMKDALEKLREQLRNVE